MKNGYDHHDHQDIYNYNLSVPERFTLDVPNQSPPLIREARLSESRFKLAFLFMLREVRWLESRFRELDSVILSFPDQTDNLSNTQHDLQ